MTYQATDDPSLVDGHTLKRSLLRDLDEAWYAAVREDYVTAERWLTETRITVAELRRRSHLREVK